ncbi:flagellar motor protein [Pseudoalteromonas tunicata]|uniref:flagellar motor protein n=1 Tax=Pseudoalteromonas tunicata TaxID=314281 RepID=UPI00273F1865|nr:flagellar motor protein [Pseudoalteromonas tunicata]MDP4982554.1 flagellar motor protein [Pseudoalteromonas tunicata]MDP5212420.1 flagellar motor protein [Pseudoalteromonas tunicata]
MDRLSFFGILIALLAIGIGYKIEGGLVASLINFPALLIVLGGTLGAVMLQSPSAQFFCGLKMFKWVFVPPKHRVDEGISKIKNWSQKARQDGYLSLEKEALASKEHFINKGLNMLIDGVEAEQFRSAMEMELLFQRESLLKSAKIYEAMGGYSPTIGILGAVLGLIQAMSFIKQPEMLGAGIATAFIATIYGVGFANLLFLPIANKLRFLIEQKMLYNELLAEGMLAILQGDTPHSIELKLSAFKMERHYIDSHL